MNHLNSMTPDNSFLINGQANTGLSVLDRGLAYGDGVFRSFAVKNGVPHQWALQYQKLAADCQALNIQCPSAEILLKDIQALFGANEYAVAKIIVTRGEGVRGYGFPADIMPKRIVIKSAAPNYPEKNATAGVCLHLCELRLSHQAKLAGIKHLNRLENVLARNEWSDASIADGILLDLEGNVIEGTMSNVFARFGTTLTTPALNQCGVSGLARERILSYVPALGLQANIQNLPLAVMMQADEIIICNSLFGAWQAVDFNGKQWPKQTLAQQLTNMLMV